uniref:tetratricopeptide repeat protein n=1 Tax=Nonomuraea pusilla TaxID=46177 RepID=UPI0006E45B16|nr:tetratricopeptide repeat protein [Nonomuraea pusilla]
MTEDDATRRHPVPDDRIRQAARLYERAVFGGEAEALEPAGRVLDAVEADLALARGRVAHARFLQGGEEDPAEPALFQQALRLYQRLGDTRGEAESLFWTGCYHQVVRGDDDTAVPLLERSRELAARTADPLTASYALRHLGIAHHRAGRLAQARACLEESTRLRRELGFLPGVATNLVGLTYLAVQEGRRDDAVALAAEAGELAAGSGAHGVMRDVEEARAALELPPAVRPNPS